MHRLIPIIAILITLCTPAPAQEKKRFAIYAMLVQSTPVELADGGKWIMDKGDTFPIVMFKEQQTKIVLQLAGTSFLVNADRTKVIEEKDLTDAQVISYRNNVNNYIESRAAKWKAEAK